MPKTEIAHLSTLRSEQLDTVHGGAHYNCKDADGVVPEEYGRYGQGFLGITDTVSSSPCQRRIRFDLDGMKEAGVDDWHHVRAHERAHAGGWDHGQGAPGGNPAFHPFYKITGE